MSALLDGSGVFGLLILDGMVLQALQLGERAMLRLLGPGAVVPIAAAAGAVGLGSASLLVPGRAHLVLLGDEFLLAAHRWPWLVACPHTRIVEQADRLAAQPGRADTSKHMRSRRLAQTDADSPQRYSEPARMKNRGAVPSLARCSSIRRRA